MELGNILNKVNPIVTKREMTKSDYIKLVDRNTELIEKIKDKDNEIERLNNIINEIYICF